MGYYAASAGMAIAYPIIPKVLAAVSVKFLLLIDLLLQFFLSWICARSQNADILIACSFAIGFLKGFLMLWFIRYAQKIFSAKNIRSEFYSYFYPLVYGGGQASMLVTAQLAYHYNWKYMYYFMMLLSSCFFIPRSLYCFQLVACLPIFSNSSPNEAYLRSVMTFCSTHTRKSICNMR